MFATLVVNPEFKPEPSQKAAHEEAKKKGPLVDLPYVTALENVRLSQGMYMLKPTAAEQAAKPRELEDMTNDELKLLMLNTGVKTEKQMKRPEIIKSIRLKLAEIDIVDDA
jgi:hypothetical protein